MINVQNIIPSVAPHIEIGAFEALWATEVSSFKQIRDKLSTSKTGLLGELVSREIADEFYQRALNRLAQSGINDFGVILDGTMDYPGSLLDADHPLTLLYYQGDIDLLYSNGISIVGTRKPSEMGIKRTQQIVRQLVQEGFTIFSGLATGIDTAAHTTAIQQGGRTVAVTGGPLWLQYPRGNEALHNQIAKDHLLISQVPIVSYETNNIAFNRHFFPERNKTMSALTQATVIIEAGQTSGTLIQARAALKQGRKVFILNNNFENNALSWPNDLELKGAIRVRTITDILDNLNKNEKSPKN